MSKLTELFRGLSPRDQRALGLLGLVLILFLGFLTVRGVNQARSRSAAALTNRKADLKKVIALATRYQEAIGDKEAFKRALNALGSAWHHSLRMQGVKIRSRSAT